MLISDKQYNVINYFLFNNGFKGNKECMDNLKNMERSVSSGIIGFIFNKEDDNAVKQLYHLGCITEEEFNNYK